jgi:hypothetical protein
MMILICACVAAKPIRLAIFFESSGEVIEGDAWNRAWRDHAMIEAGPEELSLKASIAVLPDVKPSENEDP